MRACTYEWNRNTTWCPSMKIKTMNDANVTIEIDSSSFDKQWPNHDARDRDGRCEDEVGTQDDRERRGRRHLGLPLRSFLCPCLFRGRWSWSRWRVGTGKKTERDAPERLGASTQADWRSTTCSIRQTPDHEDESEHTSSGVEVEMRRTLQRHPRPIPDG